MAQVLIRDVEPVVVDRLKDRARRKGRSLEAELRLILEEAAGISFEEVAYIRALFAGRIFDDSSDLIREDRER
jgi:plasmid stability protein